MPLPGREKSTDCRISRDITDVEGSFGRRGEGNLNGCPSGGVRVQAERTQGEEAERGQPAVWNERLTRASSCCR